MGTRKHIEEMKKVKNILLIVADSLRYDTYQKTVLPTITETGLQLYTDKVTCMNSCTELSIPWMLSGMEIYSPTMNTARDLEKKGYTTTLIHSNPVVGRFKAPFNTCIDLAIQNQSRKLKKKYHRLIHVAENLLKKEWIPLCHYNTIKNKINRDTKKYLPYTRVDQKLLTLEQAATQQPYFIWLHLMDPHTPYYPKQSTKNHSETVALNNQHLSAVRQYYTPTQEEVTKWRNLYETETREMAETLAKHLETIDYSETTVILTSDHGEEFGEHDRYGHPCNRYNKENVEAPLLIIGEAKKPPKTHRGLRKYIGSLTK